MNIRALLACVLMAAAAPAWAQPFPIRNVSPVGNMTPQATSVDPQGNAIVLWQNVAADTELHASRYVASTDSWSPSVELTRTHRLNVLVGLRIASDPAGNAIVVWRVGTTGGNIMVTRYSVASGTWSPATLLSDQGLFSLPSLAMDAAGNGLVVWKFSGILHFARYSPSSGWSSTTQGENNLETHPLVAFDASGNALATFTRVESSNSLAIFVKRFPAGSATGGAAQRVAGTTATLPPTNADTAMAMDPQGNALLLWTFWSEKTEAVRFNASTGVWSGVERVWTASGIEATACTPEAAADAHGNFVVVWWVNCGSSVRRARVQARRYASGSASWGPIVTLADGGQAPQVVVDANGDATAVWSGDPYTVQASRFRVATGEWTGALTVAASSFTGFSTIGVDSSGHVRLVWYMDQNVSGPQGDTVVQTTRWLAGATPTSGPPNAPVNFTAGVSGNALSLRWSGATMGATPASYTLVARRQDRGAVIATAPVGAVTSLNLTAPDGTFILSVRASNASGTGPESTGVTVTVGQPTTPPGPPSNLVANVIGTTVNFTWNPPASGGAVQGYLLLAGQTPGFVVPFASAPLGPAPGFVVPGVPPGTYFVRLRAQNAAGTSTSSNEVSFTVVAAPPPVPPVMQSPVVSGSTVQLAWSGPAGASYTLLARATPNGPVLVSAPVGGVTSLTVPNVGSGTYHVSAVASLGGSTSAESTQVVVAVP